MAARSSRVTLREPPPAVGRVVDESLAREPSFRQHEPSFRSSRGTDESLAREPSLRQREPSFRFDASEQQQQQQQQQQRQQALAREPSFKQREPSFRKRAVSLGPARAVRELGNGVQVDTLSREASFRKRSSRPASRATPPDDEQPAHVILKGDPSFRKRAASERVPATSRARCVPRAGGGGAAPSPSHSVLGAIGALDPIEPGKRCKVALTGGDSESSAATHAHAPAAAATDMMDVDSGSYLLATRMATQVERGA